MGNRQCGHHIFEQGDRVAGSVVVQYEIEAEVRCDSFVQGDLNKFFQRVVRRLGAGQCLGYRLLLADRPQISPGLTKLALVQ